MLHRLLTVLVTILLLLNGQSAYASDWVEGEGATSRFSTAVPDDGVSTLPPFGSYSTPGTVASSGLQMHFTQAMDALELEIFAHRNKKSITERLELLEQAVFGTAPLEELSDNMKRLLRLLSAVPLSDFNIIAAEGKSAHGQTDDGGGSSSTTQQSAGAGGRKGFFRDTTRGVGNVLHSPTFWTLVGVAGVLVCGYLLARRSGGYYENPCVSQVNPNDHYVRGYFDRNGVWHPPHMQSNPNATMTDNFSSTCNVNPYTGQLGYIPPLY